MSDYLYKWISLSSKSLPLNLQMISDNTSSKIEISTFHCWLIKMEPLFCISPHSKTISSSSRYIYNISRHTAKSPMETKCTPQGSNPKSRPGSTRQISKDLLQSILPLFRAISIWYCFCKILVPTWHLQQKRVKMLFSWQSKTIKSKRSSICCKRVKAGSI